MTASPTGRQSTPMSAHRDEVLAGRVRASMDAFTKMRSVLAALATQIADVEDEAALMFEARALTSSDRGSELRGHADAARKFAAEERARAAEYSAPVAQTAVE